MYNWKKDMTTYERFKSWWSWHSYDVLMGTLIVVIGTVVIAAYIHDSNEWKAFSEEHHCTVIAKHAAVSGTGFTSGGHFVTGHTGPTTTYKCDDGIEYTR